MYFQIPPAFSQHLSYIGTEIVRKPRGGAHLVAGYEVIQTGGSTEY